MAKYALRVFERQIIDIDGNEYLSCSFRDCVVRYSGGTYTFQDCDLAECEFQLEGAALLTLTHLRALVGMGGDVRDNIMAALGLPVIRPVGNPQITVGFTKPASDGAAGE